MNLFDFFIGFFLMNAMPHFVLGVWQGRMFSGLGFGNLQNILYGLINFALSIGLFAWKHGLEALPEHPIYLGACTILIIYFITGKFFYKLFNKQEQ